MDGERHKANLQGILKYAIANSKAEDISQNFMENGPMDLERKQFLENALNSMALGVDVIGELKKAICILEMSDSSTEQRIQALNTVRDIADHIDFANNFIQVGGSKVIFESLRSSDSKLRECAAYTIAELSQNNPFCQKHFLEAGALQDLMVCTKEDGNVASSSMHAISALVRNFEEGSSKFIELGGLDCILERLGSAHSNVFVKSCFLLRTLAAEFDAIRDEFVKLGAVQKLATFVDPVIGFDIKTETVLSAICLLAQSEEGKLHLRKTDILDTLQSIKEKNEGKEECEEILRDTTALLDCLQKEI
ncbi:uncharacterized protein LOC129905677 [Episyrphus balteatus]|uniref:uncharacterized protein LOC129905677 n=1 Tax=Episyrphus balteatus TaxID=286459 RepID=UPI002486672E|nr:uncharacterized protein LOC129905677 [Episyrphus balteatus]